MYLLFFEKHSSLLSYSLWRCFPSIPSSTSSLLFFFVIFHLIRIMKSLSTIKSVATLLQSEVHSRAATLDLHSHAQVLMIPLHYIANVYTSTSGILLGISAELIKNWTEDIFDSVLDIRIFKWSYCAFNYSSHVSTTFLSVPDDVSTTKQTHRSGIMQKARCYQGRCTI